MTFSKTIKNYFFNTEILPLDFDESGIELIVNLNCRNKLCSRLRLLIVFTMHWETIIFAQHNKYIITFRKYRTVTIVKSILNII